jgi:hypothetical protein
LAKAITKTFCAAKIQLIFQSAIDFNKKHFLFVALREWVAFFCVLRQPALFF